MGRTLQTFALVVAVAFACVANAAPKAGVGLVTSELPFRIADTLVQGNGTVMSGESVTSSKTPARLTLMTGERYQVGAGSRVRVDQDLVALEGGSVRVNSVTERRIPTGVRDIRFVPEGPDSVYEVFMDRNDEASVLVHQGSVVVSRNGEQLKRLSEGESTLIVEIGNQTITDDERAPQEVARIQTLQIEEMASWEEAATKKRSRTGKLLGMLAAVGGTAGVAAVTAAGSGSTTSLSPATASAARNLDTILQTSAAVSNQVDQGGMTQGTCGNGACQGQVQLVTNNFFYIFLGGFPVFGFGPPGQCPFCPFP